MGWRRGVVARLKFKRAPTFGLKADDGGVGDGAVFAVDAFGQADDNSVCGDAFLCEPGFLNIEPARDAEKGQAAGKKN
jgi:hypothetical protein